MKTLTLKDTASKWWKQDLNPDSLKLFALLPMPLCCLFRNPPSFSLLGLFYSLLYCSLSCWHLSLEVFLPSAYQLEFNGTLGVPGFNKVAITHAYLFWPSPLKLGRLARILSGINCDENQMATVRSSHSLLFLMTIDNNKWGLVMYQTLCWALIHFIIWSLGHPGRGALLLYSLHKWRHRGRRFLATGPPHALITWQTRDLSPCPDSYILNHYSTMICLFIILLMSY